MARRKGSARGKSTVNSRKSALENAREKLKDDPGGTKQQQQKQNTNLNNMEATTTTPAATSTTKYYNKTKLQNNNNHQQQQRSLNEQQNKTTSTTTTNNKKTQQTYRELQEETHETQQTQLGTTTQQKKLTAKQAKAAAKLAAQQQQQNVKSDTNVQKQQNEASKKIKSEKEAKLNATSSIPATTTKVNTTTTSKVTATANNANNTSTTNQRSATTTTISTTTNSSINTISSSNNSSNINTSDNSLISSISDQQQEQQMQKPHQPNSNSDNLINKTQDHQQQQQQQQQQMSDNNTTTAIAWNNSKYLHKKFKRLASTTENDVLQEAEKLRTTSMSSASSSVSSTPPPPPPPVPTTQQQQPQQRQQLEPQQHQNHQNHQPPPSIKDDHLTNGYLNKHETQHLLNNSRIQENEILHHNQIQNQVLLQLAQQQQPQTQQHQLQPQAQQHQPQPQTQQPQQIQQHVAVSSNSVEIINNSMASGVGISTTSTSSSTAGGGGLENICPYCNLSCTKRSVLQKHIRVHTGERPYPCDICGIAFKTKSNLYKHCRSRSHAARQKGIEVPPDADDGLSDQDGDSDLSNSSSEMLSRTDSPMEEISSPLISQQQQQQIMHNDSHMFKTSPLVTAYSSAASPMSSTSPASLSATNTTYLQQPQQLPLGSPAAGTLPPTTATMAPNNSSLSNIQKQAIDYKPYKPKFHNASLYATAKEAAAAAAAASGSTMQSIALTNKEVSAISKLPETHPSINHQLQQQQPQQQPQHLIINDQKLVSAAPTTIHLPPQQSPNHMQHHPSLSPSTQMKLNNHISTHQLQQLQQQQLQQLQSQASHHMLGPPPTNALSIPLAAAAYYLGQPPPGSPAAMLHPSAHIPPQSFYNPVVAAVAHQQAFSLHMMTPQQQQQFHHQLQLQQQHLQQQQQQMQLQQHSSVAPPPSPHSQSSLPQPPPPTSHIKPPTPLTNTSQQQSVQSSNSRQIHHPKASTPSNTIVHPTPQNPLHYLASAASVASALNPPPPLPLNSNKQHFEMPEQNPNIMNQRSAHNSNNSNNLLQTNSANSGMQEVTLNKEKLHEHINKIISQNEAIVENKELLLQKKYPKTLNRSRSFTNNNNASSSSTNSSGNVPVLQATTGGPPSESATNAKLAQAIVQKQQLQQQQQQQLQQQQQQYLYQQQQHQQQQQQQHQQHQQQQLQKQRLIYPDKSNMEDVPLPLNGTSKHLINKHLQQQTQIQPAIPVSNQIQYHQYRSIVTNTPSQPPPPPPTSSANIIASTSSNVPLNLSAKTKTTEDRLDLSKPPQGPMPQAPPPATPRKRHSIEQSQTGQQTQLLTVAMAVNEASNSSNSNSTTPQPSTSSAGKYPPNNSIIKNLLLNARGLAVPMGEGEDAVYICPLCSIEFRTAEDLQLHNSTYCQGSNSSANSPASSPSHKYFRSNSRSLNMPDFKILSKNPLSLVKLAWSQLKTKPSNLVLNRLSASVANTSKNTSTTTTSATSTQPSSTATHATAATATTSLVAAAAAQQPKSQLTVNELPIRFVDAPLPSPGPLLGKTPLVDYTVHNDSKSKSEEVIITKMHDDRMYNHQTQLMEHSASKRLKFEPADRYSNNKRSNLTSGGDMQPLNALELSKKEERFKRFTSSGGCMIPLSECDDVDKSPKMIRTPLLSGGSFQEVSPKKDNKLPLPLMSASQMTPKLSLGLGSSNAPQHFQFPPINQITAFNPLTLGLTEKVIPYVPGIPGPNSLQPQLPLAPPTPTQQQHLNLPPTPNHLSRTSSPNRKQTNSPMNMTMNPGTNNEGVNKSVATFGGVQNVPSEFARTPPSTNMRNIRNWQTGVNTLPSSKISTPTETTKSLKSFNFLRMADNLSPRKTVTGNDNKIQTLALSEAETRHFNLDKMSREQLIIQQPLPIISKSLSPITTLALSPLHVDTNVIVQQTNENESSLSETKAKSKFLRPTSLPLRPGTFTPKRHHGITPTANTLPLISPETPRPSKECVQLYLNGNSYTYLGLKSSTKTFYCTLNCPQPSYVQDMHKLSMYSMWQQCAENNPHPLGLKPKEVMSLYDSRQKILIFTMAQKKKLNYTLVAAQQLVMTPFISTQDKFYHHQLKPIALAEVTSSKDNSDLKEAKDSSKDLMAGNSATNSSRTLVGGYESHEDYTYIRGRGRGKFVCKECGIRCKKPSMLKKHSLTHGDVRPYTCKHCNFSFKTKGNLTKHMQSKTHYKKCIELGLNFGPMPADGKFLEPDVEFDQQSSTSAGGRTSSMGNNESDTDGDSSDNETENSNESDVARSSTTQNLNNSTNGEDNKSHLEHEAARCLLTLSMTPPIHTQSLETSIANSQIVVTTVSSSSNVVTSSPAPPPIRRVISYTSPKPPFDYHKQEQYYSNPEESKPKMINTTAANFESAPMDLTKPRSNETITTPMFIQNVLVTQPPTPSLSSNPGPVQTQAQIRDVIFGVNNNESGFLKTVISVSSRVGRNCLENYEENHHKQNEDMMLFDFRREQTLQYYKIKQTQLSRGMSVNPNVMMSSGTPPTSTTMSTTTLSTASAVTALTTVTSASALITSVVLTPSNAPVKDIPVEKKVIPAIQLPKIEIIEPIENHKAEITESKILEIPKSLKSSDESEETDEEPPSKKSLTKKSDDDKPAHNANLPAAILQPGTTDFSGVLSGGQSTNSSNAPTRTVIVGEDGFTTNNNEILPVHPRVPQITNADGRPVCSICSKTFQKQSQLVLHMNIHYMERKYKCDPCGVSFRTQGHLQKHERSEAHKNKVIMTSTFGVPTTSNPRPFECTDCKIAFRIHGHLAKHLRSKTHVQKLECLQKLPFGTYAEIERAGISLTEIDTSDCENSLISLRVLAQKLIEKDPSSKLGSYTTPSGDNSNTGLVSQDSASEDGFTAAERAAATAIASLDNNSAANTPRRANSTSEDESIALALNNNLKRRLPGTFSNGEESDKEFQEQQQEKRLRPDILANNSHMNSASPTN